MNNLNDRLKSLVVEYIGEYRRYKQLELLTGIAADNWKSWFHGRQRPTVEMIEGVCLQWPQHVFWLATGRADSKNGHLPLKSGDVNEIERTNVIKFK